MIFKTKNEKRRRSIIWSLMNQNDPFHFFYLMLGFSPLQWSFQVAQKKNLNAILPLIIGTESIRQWLIMWKWEMTLSERKLSFENKNELLFSHVFPDTLILSYCNYNSASFQKASKKTKQVCNYTEYKSLRLLSFY